MIAKRLSLFAVCGMLAFAGCGDDDESNEPAGGGGGEETTTQAAPAGDVVEVKIQNIEFMPKDVTAKVGQTIKWTNEDTVDHNVTAESADIKSDNFGEGGTFEYKPDKAGKIDYVCTIHPGQDGTINVTE